MKTITYILVLFIFQVSFAQDAFHNFGNLQIHDQGQMGFHIDLENDGTFNQNLGLAGFYSFDNSLTISGTEIPRFFDIEVAVDDHLFLEINTEVTNGVDYLIGDVITPRLNPDISLDYLNNAVYALEDDLRNVDGYASVSSNQSFVFPIGQDDKFRPLITPAQPSVVTFSAAYFNEDPNFPSTFSNSFDTNTSEGIINQVNTEEFWDFDGKDLTYVTLTWDQESQIDNLVSDLMNLRVVGWSKTENKWLDLGNSAITGDTNNGTISSVEFIPEDYDIITFGALIGSDGLNVYNAITPNGDQLNDVFIIEGVELFKNNLQIFNRWGRIVYDAENYDNSFNGVANKNVVGTQGEKLPVGTYFYVLQLTEENKSYSGWIYLTY
ncbi:gliding motility-associated C-terminal domain-containing protein [Psychroserpens sp. NJDZ02]|uniref:gliding motility-associated C-terminal domain-containing protein n=1 Tax=Psychroserpens sp. NJDZ02 TaxID=2570561 RepID=UPI0010A8CB57|nr:gliding motility-associated C-terminal domain-containing protein [Psychroserpens sp. NJDZ02]QCE41687.1 gliding motility-associated C-terminal domain-containing protein [Psychroserpens sp. NJDZ02]